MLLRLEEVTFTYLPGSPLACTALRDVDLAIDRGEFVGIVGPTGSGKSTLAQHLNGLLAPSSGRVLVDGREPGRGIPLREMRRRVGLLFQFPEAQLFEETVLHDVGFGPRSMALESNEVERRSRSALRSVGLDPEVFGPRNPFSLSGGEMRRVAIAGVLAMEPECLVLDEPTAGLDGCGRAELMGHLAELHRAGLTVVMVSHDVDELAAAAERIVVMRSGSVVMDGPTREVFSDVDGLRAAGIEVPQIPALMDHLRQAGLDVPGDVTRAADAARAVLAVLGGGSSEETRGAPG